MIRLSFDRRLYRTQAVKDAARDFADFAEFEVAETPAAIEVVARPKDEPLDEQFEGEFCNHALARSCA